MDNNIKNADVVQIGYIALDATLRTLNKKESILKNRFSSRFLNDARAATEHFIIDENTLLADISADDTVVMQLSDAGIFGGLWELSEKTESGIKIFLDDILVRQETIEILELFDANPYTYPSSGTFIAASKNGHKLVKSLNEKGYMAAVIGSINETKDRIVINGDDIRYLTPIDRLYKDEQESNMNTSGLRRELS